MRPGALATTAVLLAVLALVPGLPLWPFLVVATGAAALAWLALRRRAAVPRVPLADEPTAPHALEVALDPALHAAAPSLESRLMQVTRVGIADELGLIVPALVLTVDARLPLRGYVQPQVIAHDLDGAGGDEVRQGAAAKCEQLLVFINQVRLLVVVGLDVAVHRW